MEYKAYEPSLVGQTIKEVERDGAYHIYEYLENGYMGKETFFDKNDKMIDSYKYERTSEGKLLREIFTDSNGQSKVANEYVYDDNGALIKEIVDEPYTNKKFER